MKFIFDLDDVLFNNTKQFKEHAYICLGKVGVPRASSESYYKEIRENPYVFKDYISTLLNRGKIKADVEKIYEEIMSECKNFINIPLLEIIKKLGRNNCYLVSQSEKEFQEDKIKRTGIGPLFKEIHIVPISKKEAIYDICKRNKDEKMIFIEDKIKFIEELDLRECPNLKTVLYDEQGLEKLSSEIKT